ncbi:MAG TPA: nucleoside-diphosphate sugar epimerase/dehydratase [Tepidisphaeraceae bacterium]|nr:nucleoside-diphosphate sugar epimerase/dehydratase [Tepidisphaeraceae bacterium]
MRRGQAPTVPARKSFDASELLGREAINLDTPELQRFLAGKRVLVTGAGGSIGSEICRQAMRFCPQRLIMLERAENNLFEIDRELRDTWVGSDLRPCIGDVCDPKRVRQVFDAERPQVVFHCAAHKHVPMMEAHPCEAIKNNVFGTKVVADVSASSHVSAFVLVSTDKAVNPTSVMGATKRFAELYVQSLNRDSEATTKIGSATRFLAVRFGNVLGSSGSVVPIFQRQIEAGGPLTITHPDMKRYFMTIPEASQLVMQAGAIGQGGEIFVLDMGSPVRIVELAEALIRRNGLRPGDDIEIRFTGIRPGEKLYEELANDDEQTRPTGHPKIRVWQLPRADVHHVSNGLELLSAAATTGNAREAVTALARCVPEYRPRIAIANDPPAKADPPKLRLVSPSAESEAA